MDIQRTMRAALAASLLALPSFGFAQTVLTVTNSENSATYTLEELLAMPQTTVVTTNDYVDELTTFQGPSLRFVLEKMDVDQNANLKMVALNDFASQVPAEDAFAYDVILAVLRNGEEMSVREKGPIWVIYPMDDNPELQDDVYNGRLVWQLKSISVE
ncbi:molybdopterin-dependent oxidoreductase [Sulfitobacter sp. CW3]|uniref:molybdopterin-dependent oxidoreductase n=1 Tax=Sulfitobacter sp. CW3 TaxID=2861965 RepID=UPI001C5FBA58|nr:molybdopterin-dependent oxidoreductase [Sulfitobacter sp. CW3]MBW4961626.1 molybdopterin-dependent oxidoreductase [Sulfitobacter sp. CW3]